MFIVRPCTRDLLVMHDRNRFRDVKCGLETVRAGEHTIAPLPRIGVAKHPDERILY